MDFHCAIVVVLCNFDIPIQMRLVGARELICLTGIVVEINRQGSETVLRGCKGFPSEDVRIIRGAIAFMLLTARVVGPKTNKRVGAITSVVTFLVDLNFLVGKDCGRVHAVRVLMLNDHSVHVDAKVVRRRHASGERSICHLFNGAVYMERRFKFRLRRRPICKYNQFTWDVKMLLVNTPTIRVRLRQAGYFPLGVACVSYFVLTARSSIRIQAGIQLAKGTKTCVDESVRAGVFPRATYLITQPGSNVALYTYPAIRESGREAYVVSVMERGATCIDRAIRPRKMSNACPHCIYFRCARTYVAGLFRGVALRRDACTFLQVRI